MKPAKILFFVNGHAPSSEDFQEAAEMKATVVFRNALAVPSEAHCLEMCDGVAGRVPKLYADAYPDAESAILYKARELAALTSKVGDSPAPKAAPKAPKPTQGKEPAAPPVWNPNPAQSAE